jgi:hypothetical protein
MQALSRWSGIRRRSAPGIGSEQQFADTVINVSRQHAEEAETSERWVTRVVALAVVAVFVAMGIVVLQQIWRT